MKFLGRVTDPKDITTKEYVDKADTKLKDYTDKALEEKVDSDDIVEYTKLEVIQLWDSLFNKSK